jgi:hypothetical protein
VATAPAANPSPPTAVFDEQAALKEAKGLLARRSWNDARAALHELAAKNPNERTYRALLAYARGRIAQDDGRHPEARTEFERALGLDPGLAVAATALGEVGGTPPGDGSSFWSRLMKK